MTRRELKLLLSTSFLIAAFSQHHEAFANKIEIGNSSEKRGYLYMEKPEKYIFSYARALGSKTLFGVAINTPTQYTAENGLDIPSAVIIDCLDGRGNFNLMQKQPTKNVKEWGSEMMIKQAQIFCQSHKQFFKHSHW